MSLKPAVVRFFLTLLLPALSGCMLPQPDTPPVPLLLRPGAPAAPLPADPLAAPVADSANMLDPEKAELPVSAGLDAGGPQSTRAAAPELPGIEEDATPPVSLETPASGAAKQSEGSPSIPI